MSDADVTDATEPTAANYTLHVAGQMIHGVQHCRRCRTVLADERQTPSLHGSTRYALGHRVLVLNGGDYVVTGPYPEKAEPPPLTRHCQSSKPTPKEAP